MPNRFLKITLQSINDMLPGFRYVRINEEKLRTVALASSLAEFTLPRWDFPGCQPISNYAFPSHCFFGNAMNFSYDHSRRNGDGELLKFKTQTVHGKPVSGAYAMAACLYRMFRENQIDSENILPLLQTFRGFKRAFSGTTRMPMMRARYELLLEVRFILEEKFGGDVFCLLEEGNFRAFGENGKKGIVELLVKDFPRAFGQDQLLNYAPFGSLRRRLYFHKRAQLFVLMYHDRAVQSGGELPEIEDVDAIGPIADYELPKSYVEDGILCYNPELQETIKRAMPIAPWSQPEVEIRAAFTLAHVLELRTINQERAARGLDPIHVGHLDYWRWTRARKSRLNHHLCFTTNY